MLNNTFKYEEIGRKEKLIFLPVLPALLLEDSAGRIARELWWPNREFSTVVIIPPLFSMFIYAISWGMNNRPVVGRSSETSSRRYGHEQQHQLC
jgi:hypothetical protein